MERLGDCGRTLAFWQPERNDATSAGVCAGACTNDGRWRCGTPHGRVMRGERGTMRPFVSNVGLNLTLPPLDE